MVDHQTVCCMCGDVGFPDKIFHCNRCRYRFQHSYCSNYYNESSEKIEMCDWCQSEERSGKHGGGMSSSRRSVAGQDGTGVSIHMNMNMNRSSEYSGGGRIKQQQNEREDTTTTTTDKAGKSTSSGTTTAPSPRHSGRRYKLLKDVMC
ncbi:uncharacterized protein LOC122648660 [Telopea speciosissima]|uniref:uncharacterized protein LOC122648660 n=1 Tax=Telopea speciosissima TaxID=54955 RepID=UPI001CC74621|nr:uncharacterized protein LOC122648660 [Telopea speciosissima]